MTKIFAHRGASGYEPENTMESFILAKELGADGIEFDVHLTKDGVPVIIHDETIDRTSSGTGFVKDFTYDELKKIRFNYYHENNKEYAIPTLEEVLGFVADTSMDINIELKTDVFEYEGIEQKALSLLGHYSLTDKVILSSFNVRTLERIRKSAPDVYTALILENPIKGVCDIAKSMQIKGLHPKLTHFADDMLKNEYFSGGSDLRVWTVNDKDGMQYFFSENVAGIFTNYPDVALELREGYTKKQEDSKV